MYQPRIYREGIRKLNLVSRTVIVKETDVCVYGDRDLELETRELVVECRRDIEAFISMYPDFQSSLSPWDMSGPAPSIVRSMIEAGKAAGVGPMASVAGAVAEFVGMGLVGCSARVVVENGGDVFIRSDEPLVVGIFAGASPLSMRVGLKIPACDGMGVCTSSGSVGHSFSMGDADAVCVVSESCTLADAAATSIANRVRTEADIRSALEFAGSVNDIRGGVIIVGDKIGMWGEIEMTPL